MRIRPYLGPWPLRPLWQFVLIATVQAYGINEGFFIQRLADTIAAASIFGDGLARFGFSTLMAVVVVAAQWGFYRLSTVRQRTQSFPSYIAMIVIGALVASGVISGFAVLNGEDVPMTILVGMTLHYLILLVIVHTSIGVIGSQVSTSAKQAEDALAKLSEQERRFVASEEQARRIAAQFLHDRVQADLLVIAIELRRVGETAPADVAAQIASITEVVESLRVSEVRDTSRLLSPLVQSIGLTSALTTLAQRWRDAMQVRVDVDAAVESMSVRDGEAAGESANEALGMYRIVEQALLNAAAHGQARQVQVSVSRQARDGVDGIRVQVSDDGVGFDPAAATDGGGFAISQVWARLLGGQFTVRSEPGQGATASAWLPEAVDAVP